MLTKEQLQNITGLNKLRNNFRRILHCSHLTINLDHGEKNKIDGF